MKNALILHGTNSNSQSNWFPWLKSELEKIGWKVWVPSLPHSEEPNPRRYNDFIFQNKEWQFNEDSYIIGHSSGSVEALHLIQNLPDNLKVNACILVSVFRNDLGWNSLRHLFDDSLNFSKLRSHGTRFIFIHSDDDPHCPIEGARYLHNQIGGEFITIPGQKHFSVETAGDSYRKFPELLNIIKRITS
jgi:predicted alpha/beta hydrolase family esterase